MLGNYPGPGFSYPGTSHPGPPRHHATNWVDRPPTLYMLVMGPQGCGKSSFVNLAIGRPECTIAVGSNLCTQSFHFCKGFRSINGCDFKFTDTPGFGNEIIDDRRIIELLAENLIHNTYGDRSSIPQTRKVTGLLYIHSEDELFKNRTSQKAIGMLVKILGEQFLDRVTVLIWSPNGTQVNFTNFMPSVDSPLYPLYSHNVKPWTIPYDGNPQSVEHILGPYTTLQRRVVRLPTLDNLIQRHGGNWRHSDIPYYLKELFPDDTSPPATIDPPILESRIQELEKENEGLRNLVSQKQEEMKGLQSTHDAQLKTLQTERLRETFNREVGTKRLQNTIQDQQVEISSLKLAKDSELEKLAELEKLKHQEVSELRDKLQAKDEELTKLEISKNEEIGKLGSEKDSEIKALEGKLQEKEEELVKTKTDYERRISEYANAAQSKEKGTIPRVNGTSSQSAGKQENEIERLNSEIRRISTEYASLRNHMQLEENTELADITTTLGDINRLLEEFGGSLTEHVEKYMEDNATTEAIQPQDLLGLFGQVGNEAASKIKQDAYLLFEYAVQATVCEQLYTHLFKPFHPRIAEDENRNTFITQLYEQMTHQEAQSVAGRWRKDAFNSISRDPSFGSQDDTRTHRLITGALSVLLGKIVQIQPHEMLKEHDRALVKVITKAEDLNRLLKGSVSMLGDFQPTIFPFGESFRPDYMSEVNSKSKRTNHPETIIATVEFGIVKRYAVGGNRRPEETVLRKAGVLGSPK